RVPQYAQHARPAPRDRRPPRDGRAPGRARAAQDPDPRGHRWVGTYGDGTADPEHLHRLPGRAQRARVDLRRGHGSRRGHDHRAREGLGRAVVTRTAERHLQWEGCFNVRDLGGFPTRSGGTTAWGAVVRSDSPAALTAAGWDALRAHGIRTVVDLRDQTEREELPGQA